MAFGRKILSESVEDLFYLKNASCFVDLLQTLLTLWFNDLNALTGTENFITYYFFLC